MKCTSQQEAQSPATKRSWRLRWSLRVLFVIVGLAAIGMAWVSYQMRMGYVHEDAAKKLRELGASVDWQLAETTQVGPNAYRVEKKVPPWMERLGVGGMFQRVSWVQISNRIPNRIEEVIEQIIRLERLPHFSSYNAPLTEPQLERLLDHVQIETLYVQSMKLGRERIPCLQNTNLKWLLVARTQFSNPAIDDLPLSLEYFDATRTRISDEGLEKFVRLKNLQKLILRRTPTSKSAIDELQKKMPWCEIEWEELRVPWTAQTTK